MALSLQEIYDVSARHMLTQGKKSLINAHNCVYRHPEGLMCGVGPHIKDEFYTPELERKGVCRQVVLDALVKSGVIAPYEDYCKAADSKEVELLHAIQNTHDRGEVAYWESSLATIAGAYGLKPFTKEMLNDASRNPE